MTWKEKYRSEVCLEIKQYEKKRTSEDERREEKGPLKRKRFSLPPAPTIFVCVSSQRMTYHRTRHTRHILYTSCVLFYVYYSFVRCCCCCCFFFVSGVFSFALHIIYFYFFHFTLYHSSIHPSIRVVLVYFIMNY